MERNNKMTPNELRRIAEDLRAIQERNYYPDMPPQFENETDNQYTDRLTDADKTNRVPYNHQRNRQCSIGYHDECTDPEGDKCKCPCHVSERLPANIVALLDALVKPRVQVLKLRFYADHPVRIDDSTRDPLLHLYCGPCSAANKPDARHKWTDRQWRIEALRELGLEGVWPIGGE